MGQLQIVGRGVGVRLGDKLVLGCFFGLKLDFAATAVAKRRELSQNVPFSPELSQIVAQKEKTVQKNFATE
jgi:hypothetical protein